MGCGCQMGVHWGRGGGCSGWGSASPAAHWRRRPRVLRARRQLPAVQVACSGEGRAPLLDQCRSRHASSSRRGLGNGARAARRAEARHFDELLPRAGAGIQPWRSFIASLTHCCIALCTGAAAMVAAWEASGSSTAGLRGRRARHLRRSRVVRSQRRRKDGRDDVVPCGCKNTIMSACTPGRAHAGEAYRCARWSVRR